MTPQQEARRAIALTYGFDVIAAAVAMLIAVELRWRVFGEYAARPFPDYIPLLSAGLFALSAAGSFFLLKVHRQVWRHLGWPDVVRIAQAVALSALVFLPMMVMWNRLVGFPRTAILICIPVWLAFLFAGRMLALMRSTSRPLQLFAKRRPSAPPALLVGDEDALVNALRQMERDPKGATVRVLGLIETTGLAPGRVLRGHTIYGGVDDIGARLDLLKERYGEYPWVATIGHGRMRKVMRKVLAAASDRGTQVMSLGAEDGSLLEPVRPEDLLGRRQRTRNMAPIANLVSGSRLLITGAGGTIGTELVRQCANLSPAHITVLDSSEYNLYQIDLLLRSKFPHVPITSTLSDVRDLACMKRVMATAKPDVVIHAAALKQVPLMEMNPCEAVLTNAGGAANVAQAAKDNGVKHFVFISTDKAVDPDNVMGATKRLAEIAIARIAEGSQMATSMVRFGNVLGSSGSVVPLFEAQIAEGGPVTVTHPNITRFFMTVEEAVYLVLQAASLQKSSDEAAFFVLDMGQPVRIQTLAESMIRMKGFVPGADIKIVHTGLRPGDKMHEALTHGHEGLAKTEVKGVQRVISESLHYPGFELVLDSLLKSAGERDVVSTLYQLTSMIKNQNQPRAKDDKNQSASAG